MKFAKLSLAAIVAAGAMTTFANAAPLEEAIKGVDVSGMIRYRFYNYDTETAQNERHRFSVPVTLKIPVADNLTAGVTVRSEQNESDTVLRDSTGAKVGSLEPRVNVSSDPDTNMVKAWFQYQQDNMTLKAGKFEINTPWTDPAYGGTRGTGALGMYTGVEGWTFAAAGFTHTNLGESSATVYDNSWLDKDGDVIEAIVGGSVISENANENLYAAAAIGAMGPVNVQVWASKLTNVFDSSFFIQADTKFEGFSFKAQANQLEVAEQGALADDKGLFWGAQAGFAMDNFKLGAGYTQNDDDQPTYTLSADDAGMIKAGKQIYYKTTNALDAETMFVTADMTFGKYGVGAGYVTAEEKKSDANGYDWDETYVQASYKYSKNFGLSAYYSMLDADDKADEVNEFRFEAIYKF